MGPRARHRPARCVAAAAAAAAGQGRAPRDPRAPVAGVQPGLPAGRQPGWGVRVRGWEGQGAGAPGRAGHGATGGARRAPPPRPAAPSAASARCQDRLLDPQPLPTTKKQHSQQQHPTPVARPLCPAAILAPRSDRSRLGRLARPAHGPATRALFRRRARRAPCSPRCARPRSPRAPPRTAPLRAPEPRHGPRRSAAAGAAAGAAVPAQRRPAPARRRVTPRRAPHSRRRVERGL
jgi:hypothetical protein